MGSRQALVEKHVAYLLRPMKPADIGQVTAIDRSSFSLPWSPLTYLYEINENRNAQMAVLEGPTHLSSHTMSIGRLLMDRLSGKTPAPTIVALGGLWLHGSEAHISTIASHPNFRRRGFGELMLIGLLVRSMSLRADHAVLEVRIGNLAAQRLYQKYEFSAVGSYPRYYRDNNEDALFMEVRPLDAAFLARLRERVLPLQARFHFRDEFTSLSLDQADAHQSNTPINRPNWEKWNPDRTIND
jgi:ribosomal-protein-alanine N-acetyltransferase